MTFASTANEYDVLFIYLLGNNVTGCRQEVSFLEEKFSDAERKRTELLNKKENELIEAKEKLQQLEIAYDASNVALPVRHSDEFYTYCFV